MATRDEWLGWLRHWYGEDVVEDKHVGCLHCLARGKMLFQWHDRFEPPAEIARAFDHYHLWRVGSEPLVLVTQPYHCGHETLRALLDYCDAHGLELELNELASVHNPGGCVPILLWNRAAKEKFYRDQG